jgi:endonuclease YncB( thermonuclease family)
MSSPVRALTVGLIAIAAAAAEPSRGAQVQLVISLGTGAKDGATLLFHGRPMRLSGIVSPTDDEPGAEEARENLSAFVTGRQIRCQLDEGIDMERDRENLVGTCFVGERDVAGYQIAKGHARDCPRMSRGRYAAAEENARILERNLSKTFPMPEHCLIR